MSIGSSGRGGIPGRPKADLLTLRADGIESQAPQRPESAEPVRAIPPPPERQLCRARVDVVRPSGDILECTMLASDGGDLAPIIVARAPELQRSWFDGENIGGVDYVFVDEFTRTADGVTEELKPRWEAGESIVLVEKVRGGTGILDDENGDLPVAWQEMPSERRYESSSGVGAGDLLAFPLAYESDNTVPTQGIKDRSFFEIPYSDGVQCHVTRATDNYAKWPDPKMTFDKVQDGTPWEPFAVLEEETGASVNTSSSGLSFRFAMPRLPDNFDSWGTNGIRIRAEIDLTGVSKPGFGPALEIDFRLSDPGSSTNFGVVEANDQAYSGTSPNLSLSTGLIWLTLSKATLDAVTALTAGSPLLLQLNILHPNTYTDSTIKLGRIEVDWELSS